MENIRYGLKSPISALSVSLPQPMGLFIMPISDMKIRESGMPEESVWVTFFTPAEVLHKLGLSTSGDVIDFGCGYGTFAIPAAQITSGMVHALDIDTKMVAATKTKAEALSLQNVRTYLRDFIVTGTGLPDKIAG